MLFRSGDVDFVVATMMMLQGRTLVQRHSDQPLAHSVVAPSHGSRRLPRIVVRKEDLDRYALHSLRVGGTTVLAEADCCEMLIRLHGRWKSKTNRRYTRRSTGTFIGVSAMMIGTETSLNEEWEWGGRAS